jgi:hypothetical protein
MLTYSPHGVANEPKKYLPNALLGGNCPMSYIDEQVIARRKVLHGEHEQGPVNASNKWGLALSGGGIRSATFCLGLVRALARSGALLRFDLLSTVSGGGFTGGMLGRFFSRAKSREDAQAVQQAFGQDQTAWFLWWLRANGRYLIPRGAKDTAFVAALFIRNLVAVHFELGMLAVLLGLCLAAVNLAGWAALTGLGYVLPYPVFPLLQAIPEWVLPLFPVVWLALPVIFLGGAALAGAYWNVPWVSKGEPILGLWTLVLAAAAAVLTFAVSDMGAGPVGSSLRNTAWAVTFFLLLILLAALPLAKRHLKNAEPRDPHPADSARTKLTQSLAQTFVWFSVFVLIGLIDRCAWFLAFEVEPLFNLGQGEAALWLAIAAAVVRAVLPLTAKLLPGGVGTGVLLGLGRALGYLLTFLLCVWWVSLVHKAVLGAAFTADGISYLAALIMLVAFAVPVTVYLWRSRSNVQFLNMSSLHAFYKARLVRSYLGAANAARFMTTASPLGALDVVPPVLSTDSKPKKVDDIAFDDDISLELYKPQEGGGPVHILSVCINQTRDPRGGLFNQDRRGLGMSVASGGYRKISEGPWEQMQPGTGLSLGTWMGISGAAFSPGLGSQTRGGISALATFAGVRLGYWWDRATRTGRPWATWSAKSKGILSETFGVFEGTDGDDWFLTDGGHFENTAAYALLAEQTDVIILADCGADPKYGFQDLENLVRKARIDLQAEILFQRPIQKTQANGTAAQAPEVQAPAPKPMDADLAKVLAKFGSLDDLASPTTSACLALAVVNYFSPKPKQGVLIVIKPNLCAGLPVDLVNFKEQNPEFPQQPTSDQFFSEAQWESYFHLGTFLGGHLSEQAIEKLARRHKAYFEEDEFSPFERARKEKANAEESGAPVMPVTGVSPVILRPASRVPARISAAMAATVGSTLGFGAIATVAVASYQAIEGTRTAYYKRVTDERAALKELEVLWSKIPTVISKDDAPAVASLAGAILLTSDTLCPNNEASWFRSSPLAQTILWAAKKSCNAILADDKGVLRPGACLELAKSDNDAGDSTQSSCLATTSGVLNVHPFPQYWFYDYSGEAALLDSHPCDLAALSKENLSRVPADWALPNEKCIYAGRFAQYAEALETTQSAAATAGSSRSREEPIGPPAAASGAKAPAIASAPASTATAPDTQASTNPEPPPAYRTAPGSKGAKATEPPAAPQPPTTPVGPDISASAGAGAGTAKETASPSVKPGSGAGSAVCKGMTVFVQIYGPEKRGEVRTYRTPWRELEANVPPIEDVVASARARGRAAPTPVSIPTVRYHDAESRKCAEVLGTAVSRSGWKVEPLNPRLKASSKTIEVWIPPSTGSSP